ncbi:hypothetical protein EV183_002130 [Coemansia sp. RSA 2336]|nr:hypothetical protein EV183_002130 [Coemansia sp. RSA 2336]
MSLSCNGHAVQAREHRPKLELHTKSLLMSPDTSTFGPNSKKEILPGIQARRMGDPPVFTFTPRPLNRPIS